jgi:hypothetical protein
VVKQVFKRGSRWNAISYLINGGTFDKSPTTLTVKYLFLPEKIKVSFLWELNTFNMESNELEMSYKIWVNNQLKDFVDYVRQWLTIV